MVTDNTFSAYRPNVDCCKTFITIFYFCCFPSVIMPSFNRCDKLRLGLGDRLIETLLRHNLSQNVTTDQSLE